MKLKISNETYTSIKNLSPFSTRVSQTRAFEKNNALLNGIIIGGVGFVLSVIGALGYGYWTLSSDDKKIWKKFTSPIPITEKIEDYVSRTNVEAELTTILTPTSSWVSTYWVITGAHGTGKTTAIQKLCHEIGEGIIYVDVPENIDNFKYSLANAIGLNYQRKSGFLNFIHGVFYDKELLSELTWGNAFLQFKNEADWYRKTYKNAPVIVIDNINRLGTHAPGILKILQGDAKDAVGSELFTAVFVTSDGSTPSRHCISRGDFYRIGDITKEETFIYLEKKNVPMDLHEKCYDLVGGRINHLKLLVSEYAVTHSFDESKKILLQTVGSSLLNNWKGIEELYRPTCKDIISFGFSHELIFESELFKETSWSQKKYISKSVAALVHANFLSDFGVGTYCLDSRAEKEYLAGNLGELN